MNRKTSALTIIYIMISRKHKFKYIYTILNVLPLCQVHVEKLSAPGYYTWKDVEKMWKTWYLHKQQGCSRIYHQTLLFVFEVAFFSCIYLSWETNGICKDRKYLLLSNAKTIYCYLPYKNWNKVIMNAYRDLRLLKEAVPLTVLL